MSLKRYALIWALKIFAISPRKRHYNKKEEFVLKLQTLLLKGHQHLIPLSGVK